MLQTVEVNTASKKVIHEENGYPRMGALHVLYRQEPAGNVPFIELRQWSTIDGADAELVCEYGYVGSDGDLDTQARILPFHWDVNEALHWLDEELAAD